LSFSMTLSVLWRVFTRYFQNNKISLILNHERAELWKTLSFGLTRGQHKWVRSNSSQSKI
jgi:hypothetical protein